MRLPIIISLFFLSLFVPGEQLLAQVADRKAISLSGDLAGMEDSMVFLSSIIINDSVFERRTAANEKLIPLMRRFLSTPAAFDYPLTKLESISVLQPADKSFRFISWAFYYSDSESKHMGFIEINKPKPTFIELKEQHLDVNNIPFGEILTADNWLGMLCYNIKPFKTTGGTKYLLFGLNLGNEKEKTKICDVLTIKGTRVSFGASVFENTDKKNTKKNNRIAVTFAGDSGMRLNYDEEMKEIVFDHVEAIGNASGDITYVPDGTYEAYQYKKGKWNYIEKLANTEMNEAPRPKPILGQRVKMKDANRNEAKDFKWPKE